MRFRRSSGFTLSLLFAAALSAQQPAASDHDMSTMEHGHTHDGGFMQAGMHHAVATGVKLDAKADENSHILTLRIGPMTLPANTSHMKMPQPADLMWSSTVSGWFLAYHPKMVDAAGNAVPGTVLHHVAIWNELRSDFLCPNKKEHIFGAGGELTDWAAIPGFGYRVEKGGVFRIETMVHNPTGVSYEKVFLEISIPYASDGSPAPVKNVYPAWIDVGGCGNSSYDLPPGPSKKVGSVALKYSGVLLGVGGHMHDYGQQLTLETAAPIAVAEKAPDADLAKAQTSKSEALKPAASGDKLFGEKKEVAVLPAKTDAQGHLLEIPVVTFFQTGGYVFGAGSKLIVTSTYNNPTGKLLRDGAMGIVVGYFVPQDPAALRSLGHGGKIFHAPH